MSFVQHPELNGNSFTLTGGPIGLLMLHGFTATTIEVRPLAEFFHAHGYSVSAPLLPGHGTHPGELNRVSWKDWTTAAEAAFDDLQERCDQVFLFGESMGGLLALTISATREDVTGLLLFAPALQIQNLRFARYIAPFVSFQPKRYVTKQISNKYPWQGYTVVPVAAAAQLYQLQRQAAAVLNHVRQPVRIYQGLQDTTVIPAGAEVIYRNIGSVDKELVWLEHSPHTILLDGDFDRVAEESLDFIRRLSG